MNIKHCFQFCSRMVVCGLSLTTLLPVTVQAQTVSWTRQLGTSSVDGSTAVATDSLSNIYISGYTEGSLAGTYKGGEYDAWVAKYNTYGQMVWKRQLGTSSGDRSSSVATDSNGNVYISGYTQGSLAGTNQGDSDAWVAKYNTYGHLIWKRQLGTSLQDSSWALTTDNLGNIYISGRTQGSLGGSNQGDFDAWVAKYNTGGKLLWLQQLGTSNFDEFTGIATDSTGYVYISGYTEGSLGKANQGWYDAFVVKYDSDGALVWKRQLGTSSYDFSNDVATDSKGDVYISGATAGSLAGVQQGADDPWVAKYNSSGTLVWKRQFGTSSFESSTGIATDSKDNIYISGWTASSLGGVYQGELDAWVAKYNLSGVLLWKRQLGTSGYEFSYDVATDSNSNVYISGPTNGSLGGTNQGKEDAWVAKYSQLN